MNSLGKKVEYRGEARGRRLGLKQGRSQPENLPHSSSSASPTTHVNYSLSRFSP